MKYFIAFLSMALYSLLAVLLYQFSHISLWGALVIILSGHAAALCLFYYYSRRHSRKTERMITAIAGGELAFTSQSGSFLRKMDHIASRLKDELLPQFNRFLWISRIG